MEQKFYTIYEVADLLGLHHKTVRGFIADGRLNAVKAGKQWRIAKADLDSFMGRENNPESVSEQDELQLGLNENSIKMTAENKEWHKKESRIHISAVIDLKEVEKDKFERISNTLLALMNSRDELFEHATIHMKYDENGSQCKIFLWGSCDYITEMIAVISVLDEEKNLGEIAES